MLFTFDEYTIIFREKMILTFYEYTFLFRERMLLTFYEYIFISWKNAFNILRIHFLFRERMLLTIYEYIFISRDNASNILCIHLFFFSSTSYNIKKRLQYRTPTIWTTIITKPTRSWHREFTSKSDDLDSLRYCSKRRICDELLNKICSNEEPILLIGCTLYCY